MTPERWQLIESVFNEALALDPADREAFLVRACRGDDELRREVAGLLAQHEEDPDFLEEPLLGSSSNEAVNQYAGHYRLIRRVGRGGMGSVYLGVRDDGDFTQHVAVKLVRRGLDTDDILRRFRSERQILASLNHPNIARLYDGGTTADGRPFFVMEYVDGEPIVDYCDRHLLSVDERLEIFGRICSAVHYAHKNLIVHRDLKPSNILVTPDGPKLLDFGIAKVLHPDLGGLSFVRTRTELRFLTPEYASPEQVRGDVITTASDIYALGVLLYELLTGRKPYRLPSRIHREVERVVCEVEPVRPSAAVTREERYRADDGTEATFTPEDVSRARGTQVDRLRRRLAGDLDNIVLVAMRKEPARRYGSAEQLADDVRRHLAGLPVSAQADTFSYRARKFVRRHRIGVISAFVVALLLIGSTVAMALQSAEIRLRADEAERERVKAREIAAFLEALFEASDPYAEVGGSALTARALLDRGRERIERDVASDPIVQAQMMSVIARAYEHLGLYDDGEHLAQLALDRRRMVFGPAHEEVAESAVQLALMHRRKGDHIAAESLLVQAIRVQRERLGDEHLDVARSLNELATVYQNRGMYLTAEPLFRESLAIREKRLGPTHRDVGKSLNDLALVLHYMKKLSEAAPFYEKALEVYRTSLGPEHPSVATTLHNIAILRRDEKDYARAEQLEREALQMRRRLLGEDHMLVANSLGSLASILRAKQDYTAAEPLYREALAILRATLPDGHSRTAIVLTGLGSILLERERPLEAEPLFREALASYETAFGADNPRTARVKVYLGRCLTALKRYAEAENVLINAQAVFHGAADSVRAAEAGDALENLYRSWGKSSGALSYGGPNR